MPRVKCIQDVSVIYRKIDGANTFIIAFKEGNEYGAEYDSYGELCSYGEPENEEMIKSWLDIPMNISDRDIPELFEEHFILMEE